MRHALLLSLFGCPAAGLGWGKALASLSALHVAASTGLLPCAAGRRRQAPSCSAVPALLHWETSAQSAACAPPKQVTTVVVDPPQAGEVRVKIVATALCHTGQ